MRRPRPAARVLCILVATLVLAAPEPGEARRRKSKEEPRASYRTVAVVPPRVQITRSRVLGGVPKIEDSLEAETLLYTAAEDRLEELGYEVRRGVFAPEKLAEDAQLHLIVSDLQDRFDEVFGQMLSDPRGREHLETGRFLLGDQALLAAGAAGVEGLVFARGQGVSTGGGTKTAVFFLTLGGGIPGSGITVYLVGVDGRNGMVMDVSGAGASGPVLKKTEEIVGRALQSAASGLRKPAIAGVADGSGDARETQDDRFKLGGGRLGEDVEPPGPEPASDP